AIAPVSPSRTSARRRAPRIKWPSPGTSIDSIAAATESSLGGEGDGRRLRGGAAEHLDHVVHPASGAVDVLPIRRQNERRGLQYGHHEQRTDGIRLGEGPSRFARPAAR